MRFYCCFTRDWQGELTYDKSFLSMSKARQYFLDYVEKNTHGSLSEIANAVAEATEEFDNYIPRCMNAESDGMIVTVFQTED